MNWLCATKLVLSLSNHIEFLQKDLDYPGPSDTIAKKVHRNIYIVIRSSYTWKRRSLIHIEQLGGTALYTYSEYYIHTVNSKKGRGTSSLFFFLYLRESGSEKQDEKQEIDQVVIKKQEQACMVLYSINRDRRHHHDKEIKKGLMVRMHIFLYECSSNFGLSDLDCKNPDNH